MSEVQKMFHMLICFDLKSDVEIRAFSEALTDYTAHMQELDLVESKSPIGQRQSDTIMDTDSERDHQYFATMSFRDRAQSDAAVDYIMAHEEPGDSIHRAVFSKVQNQVFICWQDMDGV